MTVTVAAEGAVPTGEVELRDGDVVLGAGTLAGGQVTIATGAFDTRGTGRSPRSTPATRPPKPSSGTVTVTVEAKAGGGKPS